MSNPPEQPQIDFIQALVAVVSSALGGGAVVKAAEAWGQRRKAKGDEATEIRKLLWEQVTALRAELTAAHEHADREIESLRAKYDEDVTEWRDRYYKEVEASNSFRVEVAELRAEVADLKAKLDLEPLCDDCPLARIEERAAKAKRKEGARS